MTPPRPLHSERVQPCAATDESAHSYTTLVKWWDNTVWHTSNTFLVKRFLLYVCSFKPGLTLNWKEWILRLRLPIVEVIRWQFLFSLTFPTSHQTLYLIGFIFFKERFSFKTRLRRNNTAARNKKLIWCLYWSDEVLWSSNLLFLSWALDVCGKWCCVSVSWVCVCSKRLLLLLLCVVCFLRCCGAGCWCSRTSCHFKRRPC